MAECNTLDSYYMDLLDLGCEEPPFSLPGVDRSYTTEELSRRSLDLPLFQDNTKRILDGLRDIYGDNSVSAQNYLRVTMTAYVEELAYHQSKFHEADYVHRMLAAHIRPIQTSRCTQTLNIIKACDSFYKGVSKGKGLLEISYPTLHEQITQGVCAVDIDIPVRKSILPALPPTEVKSGNLLMQAFTGARHWAAKLKPEKTEPGPVTEPQRNSLLALDQ